MTLSLTQNNKNFHFYATSIWDTHPDTGEDHLFFLPGIFFVDQDDEDDSFSLRLEGMHLTFEGIIKHLKILKESTYFKSASTYFEIAVLDQYGEVYEVESFDFEESDVQEMKDWVFKFANKAKSVYEAMQDEKVVKLFGN